jgi:hypothetical protein
MLNPNKTLAIILGVSECPRALKLQALPQCANSAKDFEDYLLLSMGIAGKNVINLFDSEAAPSDQLDQIEDWLARSASASSELRAALSLKPPALPGDIYLKFSA